jgi:hypothetical protein
MQACKNVTCIKYKFLNSYTLIGTYELPSAGLQKLMEIGTIIGDRAYSVQYIADAPKYSSYFPAA